MKLKDKINYKFLRMLVKINSVRTRTELEEIIFQLVKKAMNEENATVKFAPISDRVYIQTSNKTYIIIRKEKIKIVGDSNHDELSIDEKFGVELLNFAKKKMDRDRLRLENELFSSLKERLQQITESLN